MEHYHTAVLLITIFIFQSVPSSNPGGLYQYHHGHTLLPQIITNKSSQKNIGMMMTQSMLFIRLTSNMRGKTAAVYSYQSSMSMIEKNAKY